jgi:glyoxylase-like metal-dependent hydrolase (beta-lactamase superfamily II)
MRIADGIHQVKLGMVNAYLVEDGPELIVIDTGTPSSDKTILAYVQSLGRAARDVTAIAITHRHFDHIGGLAGLREATGAAVAAALPEVPAVEGRAPQFAGPGGSLRSMLLSAAGMVVKARATPVDRILNDGDKVGPLVAVASPGHTPGHLCFYWPERRALFTGDALVGTPELAGPRPNFTRDLAEAHRSVRKLAAMDIDMLCLSHGEPILAGAGDQLRRLAAIL